MDENNDNLELMRAIAENEAAKSTTEHNGLFWFGIVALSLNLVVAILAAIFGCPCKDFHDKNCLDWVMLAIGILAACVSYAFSIVDLYITKKDKRKAEKDNEERNKANNSKTTMSLSIIQQETTRIKERAKRHRLFQIVSMGLLVLAALLAMIAIIIP